MKYRFDFAVDRELTVDEIETLEGALEDAVGSELPRDERVYGVGLYKDEHEPTKPRTYQ